MSGLTSLTGINGLTNSTNTMNNGLSIGNSADPATNTMMAAIQAAQSQYGSALGTLNQDYSTAQGALSSQQTANNSLASGLMNSSYTQNLNQYITAGQSATSQLNALLGDSGAQAQQTAISALQNAPGFQFTLQQGQQALQNSMAAKGMLNSGAMGQDLINYAQGQAETLIQNQTSSLMGVAQLGETAATAQANLNSGITQQQASLQNSLATQQASLGASQATQAAQLQANQGTTVANLLSQLGTNQSSYGISEQQIQQQALNNPLAQQLLTGLANLQSMLNSPQLMSSGANSGQILAQIQNNIKQLRSMGITNIPNVGAPSSL